MERMERGEAGAPGAEDYTSDQYTNLQRVKVYRLNDSGHWDDKGTGHVSCEYMEVRASSPFLQPPSLLPPLPRERRKK